MAAEFVEIYDFSGGYALAKYEQGRTGRRLLFRLKRVLG